MSRIVSETRLTSVTNVTGHPRWRCPAAGIRMNADVSTVDWRAVGRPSGISGGRSDGGGASGLTMHVGLNLNNREALIAPDYDVTRLLALAERAEELGLDSVWVGDSLVARPRYEPLALIGRAGATDDEGARRNRLPGHHAASPGAARACLVDAGRALARADGTRCLRRKHRRGRGEEGVRVDGNRSASANARVRGRAEGFRARLMTDGRVTFAGEHFSWTTSPSTRAWSPSPSFPSRGLLRSGSSRTLRSAPPASGGAHEPPRGWLNSATVG